MKYVYILISFLIISSCKKESAPQTAPIINLKSPTEITENSIIVNVDIKSSNILNPRLIIATDTINFWNKSSRDLSVGSSGGEVKQAINGLIKATKYFLGVTVTNNIGSSKSDIISFETLSSLAKIIYSSNVSILNLTGVSANLQYQISDYGGTTILENGLCWSVNPNPTINDSKNIDTASKSFINGILTNLNPNTKYFARAYAKNSVGVAYGAELSFTTLPNNTCFTKPIGLINPRIVDLKLTNDNKLLIAGQFNSVNGFNSSNLTRFNTDGSFSNDFKYDQTVFPLQFKLNLVVLKDGKILVPSAQKIIKINSDGTIDPSFKEVVVSNPVNIRNMSVLSDGKIIVGGSFGTINGYNFPRLARLNSDGTIDAGFTYKGVGITSTLGSPEDVKILSNGKLIVIGQGFIEKLNQDGTVDSSFNTSFRNDMYQGYSIQNAINMPNDKLLIVYKDLSQATKMIRINSDGSLDATFKSGLFGLTSVSVVHLLSDNKIMVGGNFTSFNGTSVGNLIRLNQDGSIDNSLNVGLGFGNGVPSSIVQSNDGKIIIGGSFKLYREKSVDGIIKINNDGTLCQ
jgi:uncharacterized delta-60 repeat protein